MSQNMKFMEMHMLFASRLLTVHKKEHPKLFTYLYVNETPSVHVLLRISVLTSFRISIVLHLVSSFVLILLETQNSSVLTKFWEFFLGMSGRQFNLFPFFFFFKFNSGSQNQSKLAF